jgi:hypothetical protein
MDVLAITRGQVAHQQEEAQS